MPDSQQADILIAIVSTAVLLGIIIGYFILSILRQQKRNLDLQRKNILTEINTLEKERTRVAADLHDELGPTLSFIKYQVDSVEVTDAEERELLQKASRYLDEVIGKVREIAHDMMPTALIRKGLTTAIHEFVSGLNESTSLHIEFSYDLPSHIEQDKSINIYRVVQELIQNTLRHAEAKNMIIQMKQENGWIKVICEDNGKGFDYDRIIKEEAGLGLRNLKSRLEIMGGTMQAASKIGQGTQYKFEIPIKN
jgi:signal transduction histidine kinase